jgi:cytochrome P450
MNARLTALTHVNGRLVPPRLIPRDTPPSLLQFLLAVGRNPAETWVREVYERPLHTRRTQGFTVAWVSDPDLIRKVFLEEVDAFPRAPIEERVLKPAFGEGMLTTSGEVWRHQRRAAAPGFRREALNAMLPVMAEAGQAAGVRLRAMAERAGGRVRHDVCAETTRATLDVILKTLFSANDATGPEGGLDPDQIARDTATYLDTLGRVSVHDVLNLPDWLPRLGTAQGRAAVARLKAVVDRVVSAREASGVSRADLLSLLVDARDPTTGQGLSPTQIRDNVMTFLGAGHETTSLALGWALYLIANDPPCQARLVAEAAEVLGDGPVTPETLERLRYTRAVIEEAMRLFPPVMAIPRVTQAGFSAHGHDVPAGSLVLCPVYALHRHRLYWPEPDTFMPERFLPEAGGPEGGASRHRYSYMPFGAGPRICIGAQFAMMEAVAILANILRQVAVGPAADHSIDLRVRITLRNAGGLPLWFSPR